MDITYSYTQKRKHLGAKCNFTCVGPYLSVDISPDPKLKEQFIQALNIEKESQVSKEMSLHSVNTENNPVRSCGMNHVVGGWPADVDIRDNDQVARFRKKIQKDENFISTIKQLSEVVENFVMENNSIDIYEEYFAEDTSSLKEEMQFKTLNVYRDSCDEQRKILNLSWALDGCKISGAYSTDQVLKAVSNEYYHSYVWDIEHCSVPHCVLMPDVPLNCVEFSPRDLELVAGGYSNGQIGLWDGRAGGRPQLLTPIAESHEEGVTDIKWISSKTGFEFFSGSTDGKLYCWNSRNISEPVQTLSFDQKIETHDSNKKYSITCLEYDSSLPHRFMLGTEQGTMLSCNRKFKDPNEIISSCYYTDTGPVLNIARNNFFPKLFASCSTWGIKIWTEDLTGSPMLTLNSQYGYVTDTAWSNSHASFLFFTKSTGHLELWDILIKNSDPILSFKLETDGLICISPKQQGEQIACGTANGCIHLLEVPQYTTFSSKHEKNLMAAMIDRESKREKLLEGLTREQKIRQKKPNQEIAKKVISEDEHQYSLDNKDENSAINEFNSQFDIDLKGEDDENDESVMEAPFFDMQFMDTLRSVSKSC